MSTISFIHSLWEIYDEVQSRVARSPCHVLSSRNLTIRWPKISSRKRNSWSTYCTQTHLILSYMSVRRGVRLRLDIPYTVPRCLVETCWCVLIL
jgi:hypothetical protein